MLVSWLSLAFQSLFLSECCLLVEVGMSEGYASVTVVGDSSVMQTGGCQPGASSAAIAVVWEAAEFPALQGCALGTLHPLCHCLEKLRGNIASKTLHGIGSNCAWDAVLSSQPSLWWDLGQEVMRVTLCSALVLCFGEGSMQGGGAAGVPCAVCGAEGVTPFLEVGWGPEQLDLVEVTSSRQGGDL